MDASSWPPGNVPNGVVRSLRESHRARQPEHQLGEEHDDRDVDHLHDQEWHDPAEDVGGRHLGHGAAEYVDAELLGPLAAGHGPHDQKRLCA